MTWECIHVEYHWKALTENYLMVQLAKQKYDLWQKQKQMYIQSLFDAYTPGFMVAKYLHRNNHL